MSENKCCHKHHEKKCCHEHREKKCEHECHEKKCCHKHHDKCKKIPQPLIFEAILNGLNEVPPNASTAIGSLIGVLSADRKEFRFILQTLGLINITTAQIQKAPINENGPIVKNININPLTGTAQGVWSRYEFLQPLTKKLVKKLLKGLLYVNVNTLAFPNGEIRGQLVLVSNNIF